MENNELELKSEQLNAESNVLTPEKEAAYRTRISSLEEENADLKQQLAYLKKALYGQKSEKTEVIMENAEQLSMFNEAEENTEEKIIEKADKITVVTHERKKHSTHKDSFENLETEEIIHTTEGRICPECGSEMEVIGKEFIRDELAHRKTDLFCTLQEIKGCYIISQSVYPGTNYGDLLGADIKVRIDSSISAVDKEAKLTKAADVADKFIDVGMCHR